MRTNYVNMRIWDMATRSSAELDNQATFGIGSKVSKFMWTAIQTLS